MLLIKKTAGLVMTTRIESLKKPYVDPDAQPKIKYSDISKSKTNRCNRGIQRVLLISPAATLFKGDLPRCTYPLGLGYIASVLENNDYEVAILDCLVEGYYNSTPIADNPDFVTYGIDRTEISKRIAAFCPDIVGVSSIFSNQSDAVGEVFAAIGDAAPNAYVVTGGAHARYFPHNYFEDFGIDAVFLSESEATFLHYVEYLNGAYDINDIPSIIARLPDGSIFENSEMALIRSKERNDSGFWAELDQIPFPAWHLYNMEAYFDIKAYQSPYTIGDRVGQIYTSRGCTAKCTFCTTTNFWGGKLRRRSPENVLEELRRLQDGYAINEFHIQDDNITNDLQHAKFLFQHLKELKLPWCTPQGTALWRMDEALLDLMVDSGCYQVTFAIESGCQRVLNDLIRKPLDLQRTKHLIRYASSIGLSVHGFFIVGMPPMFGHSGETVDEMYQSYRFAEDAGFHSASFFTATPIVGSVLLSECLRQDFIAKNTPLYRMSYKQGLIDVPGLWRGVEIASLAAQFNKDFNRENRLRKGRKTWTENQY
ncbi:MULTISPECIES: B12-binding domain-containing radical SAM protein [unclassified Neorhizobium]|uniref:B12-binding domain-containing radical SAM protein n=1 Tax=unclassified Neorhizobium TaxID=2629175 RepID=UPI001FF6B1A3|nr:MULTISPECIES: radical SAM protein [unclassified Neorhizobium]MCJ9668981.1 B12-binding domain-containing radical SAM protein [Neorhizobium sp. SHOUNA12B]MCJ9744935.1 B12-binding domain-containing radical SAM protein [Neorhizobium sp. SHOUNA12A]